MKDTRFAKLVLFVNALVPLALLLWDVYHKRVGANPLEFATRTTGMLTLLFFMISLAVTPARQIMGLNWLVKFRRMLGLFAFFYGSLHLLTYVWFDRYFNLKSVPGDVATRPFIALGMLAFFLMAPLAITSTDKMIKRLGGPTLAQSAQTGVCRRRRGCDSFLVAGEIGYALAANFWFCAAVAARASFVCKALPAK